MSRSGPVKSQAIRNQPGPAMIHIKIYTWSDPWSCSPIQPSSCHIPVTVQWSRCTTSIITDEMNTSTAWSHQSTGYQRWSFTANTGKWNWVQDQYYYILNLYFTRIRNLNPCSMVLVATLVTPGFDGLAVGQHSTWPTGLWISCDAKSINVKTVVLWADFSPEDRSSMFLWNTDIQPKDSTTQ
jgi:hypothetical protein